MDLDAARLIIDAWKDAPASAFPLNSVISLAKLRDAALVIIVENGRLTAENLELKDALARIQLANTLDETEDDPLATLWGEVDGASIQVHDEQVMRQTYREMVNNDLRHTNMDGDAG